MEHFKDPIAWAVIFWALKEIYRLWKDRGDTQTSALKANTSALHEMQLSLKTFEERLSQAADLSAQVPKMQRDLDVAHAHIRFLAPHLYNR
jgi:hypothetical protein